MANEQFSNAPQTTLVLALAAAAQGASGSMTVAGSGGFPTVPQFRIVIDQEILIVTALAGAVWTVTRGQENTQGATHAIGATVSHILTAGGLTNLSPTGPLNLAVQSVTVQGSGPYTPNLPGANTIPTPAGVVTGKVWDYGGMAWNVMAAGATANGSDDTTAIRTAALAANTAGGGEVFLPYPVTGTFYGITASLTLYSKVTYRMAFGAEIRWIGGVPGADTYMIGCVATSGTFTDRPGLVNVTLNAQNRNRVIPVQLDSVRQGYFDHLYLTNANGGAGQYAMKWLASVGATSANNTTFNVFVNLRIDSCQRGLQVNGNQTGMGVTNNYVFGATMITTDAFIDFQQWCDSNYFEDCVFSGGGVGNAFTGITFGSAVSDLGVHSERFKNCSIDNTQGSAAQVMLILNICAGILIEGLFSGCCNVGGVAAGFELGTLFTTVAGTASYRIEWINQGGTVAATRTYIFEKGRRLLTNPSDVNGVDLQGAATGVAPAIVVIGTDANIDLALNGQGTGRISLAKQMANWLDAVGATAGNAVQFQANGVSVDIPIHITPKGAGEVRLSPGQGNYLAAFGIAAGSRPHLDAQGPDPNINIGLVPKGTGVVDLANATVALGGGAAPTLGTIGGTGPAAAAQNCWVKINAAGVATYLPGWR
jgi:hypothetical protein